MLKNAQKVTVNLMDGNINGRYEVTLDNWNIIMFKIPREMVKESSKLRYINTPGIFFLFGEQNAHHSVYIEKADNIFNSLLNHANKHNGYRWNDAIVFVSSDLSLDVIKLKYLEQRLHSIISESRSYPLLSSNNEFENSDLNYSDLGPMETLIENVKLVIPFVGYNPFEKVNFSENISINNIDNLVYFRHTDNRFNAKGILHEKGGIIVFKGSKFSPESFKSLSRYLTNKRNKLIDMGVIKESILQRDLYFSSTRTAANVISGISTSKSYFWKNINGDIID